MANANLIMLKVMNFIELCITRKAMAVIFKWHYIMLTVNILSPGMISSSFWEPLKPPSTSRPSCPWFTSTRASSTPSPFRGWTAQPAWSPTKSRWVKLWWHHPRTFPLPIGCSVWHNPSESMFLRNLPETKISRFNIVDCLNQVVVN